jgi:UDPglucose 6-dehydrogenase
MNEIANFCERVGADVDKVRIGIGTDERIGKRFLFPGIGYGGSCFPKDVQALVKSGIESGYKFEILDAVLQVNDRQKTILFEPLLDFFGGNLQGKTIAVWGLAFKPDTDDIREAPALYMIDRILAAGGAVKAHDPEAMKNVQKLLGDKITYFEDAYLALEQADALLICTEWSVFRTPEFERIASLLKQKCIFDGRNLYDTDRMNELGFYYKSIGRETVNDRMSVAK